MCASLERSHRPCRSLPTLACLRVLEPGRTPLSGFRIEQARNVPIGMVDALHYLETLIEETVMIAPYILPFTLRGLLGRVGAAPTLQGRGRRKGTRLPRWQQTFVAFEDWLTASNLAWRGEILLGNQLERFHHFCGDCGGDTPHEGFDKLGTGWYGQICCRCRRCGRQGMTVWPIAWW